MENVLSAITEEKKRYLFTLEQARVEDGRERGLGEGVIGHLSLYLPTSRTGQKNFIVQCRKEPAGFGKGGSVCTAAKEAAATGSLTNDG